jgi:hypothetical protein
MKPIAKRVAGPEMPELSRGPHGTLDDVDQWYEQAIIAFAEAQPSVAARKSKEHFVRSLYVGEFFVDPIFRRLYSSYEKKCAAGRDVSFKFADIVMWVLSAAASGIVGNLAYDALKTLVRRLTRKKDAFFERIVSLKIYERERTRIHGDDVKPVVSDKTTETKIRLRYKRTLTKKR